MYDTGIAPTNWKKLGRDSERAKTYLKKACFLGSQEVCEKLAKEKPEVNARELQVVTPDKADVSIVWVGDIGADNNPDVVLTWELSEESDDPNTSVKVGAIIATKLDGVWKKSWSAEYLCYGGAAEAKWQLLDGKNVSTESGELKVTFDISCREYDYYLERKILYEQNRFVDKGCLKRKKPNGMIQETPECPDGNI